MSTRWRNCVLLIELLLTDGCFSNGPYRCLFLRSASKVMLGVAVALSHERMKQGCLNCAGIDLKEMEVPKHFCDARVVVRLSHLAPLVDAHCNSQADSMSIISALPFPSTLCAVCETSVCCNTHPVTQRRECGVRAGDAWGCTGGGTQRSGNTHWRQGVPYGAE